MELDEVPATRDVVVAVDGDEVVGYASLRFVGSEGDGAIVTFVGRTRTTPGSPAPGEEALAVRFANERVVSLE